APTDCEESWNFHRRHGGHGDFTEASGFSVPLRVLRVDFSRANSAPAGRREISRRLAGGERSEPPDRRGITICTPAGVAGAPLASAGARRSRRHGVPGVRKRRSPLAKFPALLR